MKSLSEKEKRLKDDAVEAEAEEEKEAVLVELGWSMFGYGRIRCTNMVEQVRQGDNTASSS